jgi:hypothetical protein
VTHPKTTFVNLEGKENSETERGHENMKRKTERI